METNFPDLPHSMAFTYFSNAMGIFVRYKTHPFLMWWGIYTIGSESNGKISTQTMIWEKYECHIPRFSTCDGFYWWEVDEVTHFPCDEVYIPYAMIGSLWGKITHTMGKVYNQCPRFSPYNQQVLLHSRTDRKTHGIVSSRVGTLPPFLMQT